MRKKIDSDIIFLIGVFLLPFENFIFAPSAGWATLTPIIFAVYILMNFKSKIKISKKSGYFLIGLIIFNLIAYLSVGINLKNVINAMISIGLGFVSLISMYIYYNKNKNLDKIIRIISISYIITLIIGLIEFCTIKFNINVFYDFFKIIFKRNYMRNKRVQFFFTEPSFIGMHMFGILLPLYLFTNRKKILNLIIVYVVAALYFECGVRIILDVIAVATIFMLYTIIRKKNFILLFVMAIILILSFITGYKTNYRIRKIIDDGIYSDGSLASRYFRIQASIYGYINDFPQVLIGYGVGNSLKPLRSGYDNAIEKYKSSYVRETEQLADPEFSDDSVSYCLYIRFISEFGLIAFLIVLYYIIKVTKESSFKYKWPYLLTVMYIYIQFESYAFYAIWIYLLCMYYTKSKANLSEENHV